jgi:hypothetical protein
MAVSLVGSSQRQPAGPVRSSLNIVLQGLEPDGGNKFRYTRLRDDPDFVHIRRCSRVRAPAVFVLLWASGFIGAKLGLPYAEPMTFLAVRMGAVVLVLGIVILLTRPAWPSEM